MIIQGAQGDPGPAGPIGDTGAPVSVLLLFDINEIIILANFK